MSMMTDHNLADIGSTRADLAPSTDRYAKRFGGPAGSWLLSRQTAALRELIAPWPESTVLDVGGGHGQVASPLIADGHDVRVLSSCSEATGQLDRIFPRPAVDIGDLTALPYPDCSFDVVTSLRLFAHVTDWRLLMAELCRVARHAVIVDFPLPGGANALEPLLFGLKKRIEGDTRRFRTISRTDIRQFAEARGFPDRREIGQFVLPMVLHRKLGQPALSNALERGLGVTGLAARIGTPVVMRVARQVQGA